MAAAPPRLSAAALLLFSLCAVLLACSGPAAATTPAGPTAVPPVDETGSGSGSASTAPPLASSRAASTGDGLDNGAPSGATTTAAAPGSTDTPPEEEEDECDAAACAASATGPCDAAASCVGGGVCRVAKKDDGARCVDIEGFSGSCKAGVCVTSPDPVIKSRAGNIVVHVPADGDLLFAAPDMDSEASLRSVLSSLTAATEARDSLEERLSTQEDSHSETSTHGASLAEELSSVKAATTIEFATVADAQGGIQKDLEDVSNSLSHTERDVSNLQEAQQGILQDVRNHGVGLATLTANKADRTFVEETAENIQSEIDATESELRAVQLELRDKVITIDDKTGEHTNLFQGIEGDIAALGTQIDGHGSRLGKLEQAQVTAADIDAKVEAAVVPLATKATTESLGRRIDALEDEVGDDFSDIKTQLSYAVAMIRAYHGLPIKPTFAQSEVDANGKIVCHNSNLVFDSKGLQCKECPSKHYDVVAKRCMLSPIQYDSQPGTASVSSCNAWAWSNKIMGARAVRYYVAEDNTQLLFTYKTRNYLSSYNGCYSSSAAYLQLFWRIDDTRDSSYCAYDYRQMAGRQDNEHGYVGCQTVRTFKKGWHTFDLDMQGLGQYVYTYGGEYSSLQVRPLGKIKALAEKEPEAKCQGRTSQTLLATYQASTKELRTSGCGTYYDNTFSANFASRGPWTLRSTSGLVRVSYTTFTYLDSLYCAPDAFVGARLRLNNVPLDFGTYTYLRLWNVRSQQHDTVRLEAILTVTPNTPFKLEIEMIWRGYRAILYGGAGQSSFIVEELPQPKLTVPASLPTGCNGVPRNIFVADYFRSDYVINAVTGTSWVINRADGRYGPYTVNVNNDQTRVRMLFKARSYQYGITNWHTSHARSYLYLRYVIDNVAQGWCTANYETGYGYSYDNRHKPVVCDHTYTLSKGSHKIQLEIHTLGYYFTVYGGRGGSIILIEELTTDTDNSNN